MYLIKFLALLHFYNAKASLLYNYEFHFLLLLRMYFEKLLKNLHNMLYT